MFRIVEHQADIAVELEAEDCHGLFETALEALKVLLTGNSENMETDADENNSNHLKTSTQIITASGFDNEERLIGLMNEFLYLCQVKEFYPVGIGEIKFGRKEDVSAEIVVFAHGQGRELQREIKAATFHDINIKTEPLWSAKVVLDV